MDKKTALGKLSFDKIEIKPSQLSRYQAFIDFVTFLLVSASYIVQGIYYTIMGWPEKDLNNELCVVTGGGGGLGRLLSMRLSRLGAKVILWDISQQGLDETTKLVESMGGWCKSQIVDISNRHAVYKAAAEIKNNFGDVTMLINNAGVVSGRALLDTPDELIERSFSVNTLAHFWTVKAFLPTMLENDHGHIVSIASMASHVGIPKLIDYCASKFAAFGFDEALRLELEVMGAEGVHTTAICPYFIQETGMFDTVNSRWVKTLNSNDVADRIIEAIRKNEKVTLIPWHFRFMLIVKWIVPWGCVSGYLRRLVPDATPEHHLAQGISTLRKQESTSNLNNNNNKTASKPMIIQRMSSNSIGERVL